VSFLGATRAAVDQAWPPFVLVAGLLVIGALADAEGLFAAVARLVSRRTSSSLSALCGLLVVTALTSALLNLDTAAAFMTPVLIYAAGELQADNAPFLYGAVLLANAGSLLLPGSNLTNLLVFGSHPPSGLAFLERTWLAAAVAVLITIAGLAAWAYCRQGRPATPGVPSDTRWRPAAGHLAAVLAGVLVVADRAPALPVLAVAALAALAELLRGHTHARVLIRAVGPASLAGLLLLAVAVGALAREWSGPARLLAHATATGTTAIAAGTSVLLNNLPAAALLGAHPSPHPYHLLAGLNLGPNLAATGSLSSLIWLRTARRLGATPSLITFSRIGAPLALLSLLAASALLTLTR